MTPIIATEIEFYLHGAAGKSLDNFWQQVRQICDQQQIFIYKMEEEKGEEQFEIALVHSADVQKIIDDTNKLKLLLEALATTHDMQVDFSAKPKEDQPGSGLHVHVHLADEHGKNLYYKDDARMSDELAWSLGGLLATMEKNLSVFVPSEESKARLMGEAHSNAPSTISWGANNRTVAIRLPDKDHHDKHIEHRVAGADADVAMVVKAILDGIEYGIKHQLMPSEQIYGDASLPMYALPRLIAS